MPNLLEETYSVRFTDLTFEYSLKLISEEDTDGHTENTGGFIHYVDAGVIREYEVENLKVHSERINKFVPVSERLQKVLTEKILEDL